MTCFKIRNPTESVPSLMPLPCMNDRISGCKKELFPINTTAQDLAFSQFPFKLAVKSFRNLRVDMTRLILHLLNLNFMPLFERILFGIINPLESDRIFYRDPTRLEEWDSPTSSIITGHLQAVLFRDRTFESNNLPWLQIEQTSSRPFYPGVLLFSCLPVPLEIINAIPLSY